MTALFFLVPIICWIAFTVFVLKLDICLKEMAIQIGLSVLVVFGLFMLGSYSQTYDTKIVNGVVTALKPIKKDCDTTWDTSKDPFCTNQDTRSVRVYPDSCSTDSKGKKTCTARYQTEYRSVYPWERRYFVDTTVGNHEITRVDYQGVNYPPRFTSAAVGDPASGTETYTNYIRGASDTLFSEGEPTDEVPLAYPQVRDYYNISRVLVYGVSVNPDLVRQIDARLDVINSKLADKGVNVIVALVAAGDKDFPVKLARAWDSHNINDVVVTLGTDGTRLEWVDIRSWSKTSMVNIALRDNLLTMIKLAPDEIRVDMLESAVYNAIHDHFQLQPMENFEYLADDIPAPTWAMVLAFIFLLIATPALTYLFHRHDFFGAHGYRPRPLTIRRYTSSMPRFRNRL